MILQRPTGLRLQRGVIILPSAFTLGNLFLGIWAIVSASRGDAVLAAWLIVFAAILDTLDGSIARATRTGSSFGQELDSLVDAISFGVAPAYILFTLYFNDGWSWTLPYLFIVAAVLRLARFNVQQGGTAHRLFVGLPSPSAAILITSAYPFSQTTLARQFIPEAMWPQIMAGLTLVVAALMLSQIPYPALPRIGLRTRRGVLHLTWMSLALAVAITVPRYYFFPATMAYTCIGVARWFMLGLLDRLPDRDPLLDEPDPEELRPMDYRDIDNRTMTGSDRSHSDSMEESS
jgi:CDP-diacylglycerol--serine O-phosphatidyltransferase